MRGEANGDLAEVDDPGAGADTGVKKKSKKALAKETAEGGDVDASLNDGSLKTDQSKKK